jgi:hypothetical protein
MVRRTEEFPSSLSTTAIRPGCERVLANETKIEQPSFVGIAWNGLPGNSIYVMGCGAGRLQSAAFASDTSPQFSNIKTEIVKLHAVLVSCSHDAPSLVAVPRNAILYGSIRP